MPFNNVLKYWNGSSWKESADFSKIKMWTGTTWRTIEIKYAGASGTGNWNIPYNVLDAQYVTSTYTFVPGSPPYVPAYITNGYSSGVYGNIEDGTSNIYSGAQIIDLYFTSGPATPYFYFTVAGNRSNSGWTTLSGGGYTYTRSSATYAYNSSLNRTEWYWQTNNDPFNGSTGNGLIVPFYFT